MKHVASPGEATLIGVGVCCGRLALRSFQHQGWCGSTEVAGGARTQRASGEGGAGPGERARERVFMFTRQSLCLLNVYHTV